MPPEISVGIIGLGAIGLQVAKAIDQGQLTNLRLVAISSKNINKAAENVATFAQVPCVTTIEEVVVKSDVVIECAPASIFDEISDTTVKFGKILIPASVGALLPRMDLVEKAQETGAKIIIPTGALIGLDAVRAAAEGIIESIKLTTRKPPNGLAGAPYLIHNNISVENLDEAKLVFEGSAREGAKGFPANVNVAAALSLAGIGPDKTALEIWADPKVDRNMHTITVEADSARFTMTIENIPTVENPKTGKITALSIIASLRRLTAPIVSGT
ncbi:MAG: aspartate dehydrogenase [Rhodospirillaceae bacterium]|nr:aspartate dehydrogenase [Rhodospirillaceae bacterium]